jgi:ubiquinone/menaquinone biosynthesis C-methylase UbiE
MKDKFSSTELINRWSSQNVQYYSRINEIDILLEIIKYEYKKGTSILDIGIAAGAIEKLIFKNIPEVQIVGIETSPEIIDIARMKLKRHADWFDIVQHNLIDVSSVSIPAKNYSIALSLQTMHNLPHNSKIEIIKFVASKLMPGGLFLILDTLAIESAQVFNYYRCIWKYLEKNYGTPVHSGNHFEEYINILEDKADQPAKLEQYMGWLRESGFESACLCLLGNRALLGARKTDY